MYIVNHGVFCVYTCVCACVRVCMRAFVHACAQALSPGTGRSISTCMEYALTHDVRNYVHVGHGCGTYKSVSLS